MFKVIKTLTHENLLMSESQENVLIQILFD